MKKLKSTKRLNFLFKLNRLLNQPDSFPENTTKDENNQIISWNEDGTIILIKDRKRFEEHILPKYFLYKKYNNFIRQLHMYDFKKLKHYKNDQIAYKNEMFTKNGYSNLEINRKKVIHHYKTKKKIMKFNKNIINCNDKISNVVNCNFKKNDNQLSEYESRIQNLENSINLIMKKKFINSKKNLPLSSDQSQNYLNTTSQTQACVNNTDNDFNLRLYYKKRLEIIIKTIKKYLIYKNNKLPDEDGYLYNKNLEQYDDRTIYLLINKLNSHFLKSSRNNDIVQTFCPFQSVVRDYDNNNKMLMIKSYSQDLKNGGTEKISNYNYLTDDNCSSNS